MGFDLSHAFEGDSAMARRFLRGLPSGAYYTYVLLRPDGLPFYVGKGRGNRVLQHELEAMRQSNLKRTNPHKCNTIRSIVSRGEQLRYRIDRIYADADQISCLEREAALIGQFRRRCDGGTLTNLASGLGNLFGADPDSAARHAATLSGIPRDDPERAALNLYLKTFGAVDSVPIKPLSSYRARLVPAMPSSKDLRNPTMRNALTIIAVAAAEGVLIEPGATLPRSFTLFPDIEDWPLPFLPPEEVGAVVENGAASDILKLGLVSLIPGLHPEQEAFQLTEKGCRAVIALMGRSRLSDLGVA